MNDKAEVALGIVIDTIYRPSNEICRQRFREEMERVYAFRALAIQFYRLQNIGFSVANCGGSTAWIDKEIEKTFQSMLRLQVAADACGVCQRHVMRATVTAAGSFAFECANVECKHTLVY